jgi:predicted nucleic acid-binding protein
LKYLLDTCIVSELTRQEPDPDVLKWFDDISSDDLFLSVISIGEIRKGISKLPSSRKKEKLNQWLNSLVKEYGDHILPIDLSTAENWGIIQVKAERAGTPMPSINSLISAAAYTNNLILATRNEKDFIPAQIPTVNPWSVLK